MRKALRYFTVLLMVLAFIVAGRQLAMQQTAASEILVTGLYVFGSVVVLFALLVGVGRGLGSLINRDNPNREE